LTGKTAIVTGGGSGLGRAIALELGRSGRAWWWRGGGRNPSRRRSLEDWGGYSHHMPTDVRDPEQVERFIDDAVKRFGRVDVLVNNAARQLRSPGGGAALWPADEDRERVAATVPLGRIGTTEEVACWAGALCSHHAEWITGENLVIDGGHWLERVGYMPALGKARR
jgi:NAD(P)-dependent dehydrogenase (short-subunit alcohol dehydrogenase family)